MKRFPRLFSDALALMPDFRVLFRCKLILGGLLAVSVTPSLAQLPQLGVYRGPAPNSIQKINDYSVWLNQPDMWAEDFLAHLGNWTHDYPGWLTGPYATWLNARPGRKWLMSVPMLTTYPSGQTLAKGAAGEYDAHFRNMAKDIHNRGIATRTIIRLGWEMNGGWYPWAAAKDPASFITYWRRIVGILRANAPGIIICYNPIVGHKQINAMTTIYPGDEYLDIIALDAYDESYNTTNGYPWPAGADAQTIYNRRKWVWDWEIKGGTQGLDAWQTFAANHNKPFGIAEWGVWNKPDNAGGLDNPFYIQKMYDYVTTHPIAFAVYFDVSQGMSQHQLSPPSTQFPLSTEKFHTLFSGASTAVDIIKDNTDSGVTLSGSWTPLTTPSGFYGTNYLSDGNTEGKSVTYNFTIPTTGSYSVYARWISSTSSNTWVPYTITHAGGNVTVNKNQSWGGGAWSLLGTFTFNAGAPAKVVLGNGGSGVVVADAVRLTKQ